MSILVKDASFAEAMCIFIADCMSIVSKYAQDKAAAIKAMVESANAIFHNCPKTNETISEVMAVIRQMVAA